MRTPVLAASVLPADLSELGSKLHKPESRASTGSSGT